jgi:hypothetical protein
MNGGCPGSIPTIITVMPTQIPLEPEQVYKVRPAWKATGKAMIDPTSTLLRRVDLGVCRALPAPY